MKNENEKFNENLMMEKYEYTNKEDSLGIEPCNQAGVILIPSMGNCLTTFIFDDGNAAFLFQILGNFSNDICFSLQKQGKLTK